jgi:hypothetical protein
MMQHAVFAGLCLNMVGEVLGGGQSGGGSSNRREVRPVLRLYPLVNL